MLTASLLTSMLFATFTQPLSMGLTLMCQTIITSYMLFKFTKMSWYAYMLVIVIVGGLLVTFMYVAVLIPTEPHARRSLWSLPVMMPTTALLVLTASKSHTVVNWAAPAIMYSKSSMIITMMLIALLLLALMIVVNNTYSLKGPMRSY